MNHREELLKPDPAKEERLAECVRYFRENPGFHRLFVELKEKYRSLGKLRGKVRFDTLQPQEQDALSSLLREDLAGAGPITLKINQLEATLEKTRFAGLDLEEILMGYWENELRSKYEESQAVINQRDLFFEEMLAEFVTLSNSYAADWLKNTWFGKENAYLVLLVRYERDRERLRRDLRAVGRAVEALPCWKGRREPTALFAAAQTGDPHFFDENTETGQLLLYAMMYLFGAPKPMSAEERAGLWYRGGLYSNETSNVTLCCGLRSYLSDGAEHQGWFGFYQSREPLQVSLGNLNRLKRVISPKGYVFIVENPVVFTAILSRWLETRNDAAPDFGSTAVPPLVCTQGQVKLASLVLLDFLAETGAMFYYSGDYDPEGLLIADKLKRRYGTSLILWRYTKDDFYQSNPTQEISHRRMKQLEKLIDPGLHALGQIIMTVGRAGYQERLLDELWNDVDRMMAGFKGPSP